MALKILIALVFFTIFIISIRLCDYIGEMIYQNIVIQIKKIFKEGEDEK